MLLWFHRLWHRFWGWTPAYWLRCHTVTRYHMLDCRSERYRWGWHDRCELILDANMAILCDYIEQEDPFNFLNWDWNEDHKKARAELEALYRWWKVERKQEHAAVEKLWEAHFETRPNKDWLKVLNGEGPEFQAYHARSRELSAMDEELYKKDDEMMHRLINIRGHLWT